MKKIYIFVLFPSLCVLAPLQCVVTVCCCVPLRVNLCLLTLSAALCASASRGRGWRGASTETISDSWRRISKRILVSGDETLRLWSQHVSWCLFPLSGCYFTGDGAYRSEDGFYQITGRMDDVINVSGHRLGTAEIEDALVRCITQKSKLIIVSSLCFSCFRNYDWIIISGDGEIKIW